jgi:hypothetical protein
MRLSLKDIRRVLARLPDGDVISAGFLCEHSDNGGAQNGSHAGFHGLNVNGATFRRKRELASGSTHITCDTPLSECAQSSDQIPPKELRQHMTNEGAPLAKDMLQYALWEARFSPTRMHSGAAKTPRLSPAIPPSYTTSPSHHH